MTVVADSSLQGCLAPAPAMGLDEEDNEVEGLDEGLLDGTVPINDDNLEDFLQLWIACLTGIGGTLVRPRYQEEPPNLPSDDAGNAVNWVAFGINLSKRDTFAAISHIPDGDGSDELTRTEEFEVPLSFYGPQARSLAGLFADEVQVAQNREVLDLNNMGLIETTEARSVPALIKQRWLYRVDMTARMRRQVVRPFQVLNILRADGVVTMEPGVSTPTITETFTAQGP